VNYDGTFTAYQQLATQTAVYPGQGEFMGLAYAALGLSGEAGEVADQVSKVWRDSDQKVTDERREKIKKELGDVFWYAAQVCTELGISMSEVAKGNIEKLSARKATDKIHGEGSDR
jgi:NTP pyrophosphatase (non-canonical NTP hydrolase)